VPLGPSKSLSLWCGLGRVARARSRARAKPPPHAACPPRDLVFFFFANSRRPRGAWSLRACADREKSMPAGPARPGRCGYRAALARPPPRRRAAVLRSATPTFAPLGGLLTAKQLGFLAAHLVWRPTPAGRAGPQRKTPSRTAGPKVVVAAGRPGKSSHPGLSQMISDNNRRAARTGGKG